MSFRSSLLLLALLAPASLAQAPPESAALPEGIEATGDTTEVRALTAWAEEHRQSNSEQARKVAERTLVLARDLNDQRGIGESLMILGKLVSDLLQEEAYYREAQEIFAQIDFQHGLNYSRLGLGSVYRRRGELEQALTFYFDALEGFERLGDREGQAAVLNSIGVTHRDQDNLREAVTYYEQATALAETLDNPPLLATILVNLGAVLARQGSYEKAETIYGRALVISEEEGLRVYIAAISNNLGLVYNEQGRYEQALQPLLTARRLNEELGRIEGLMPVYDELGKTYMGLGELDRALSYAHESLRLARETGSLDRQMEAHATLSDIYEVAGDPVQSLVHYRQYADIKDSVFTAEKAEIITEMETRYETEEKQRAIERLEQENQIQALRQILLLGGIVVALLVAGLFYNRYRLKRRANRLLEARKEEIQEKAELLQEKQGMLEQSLKEKELLVKEIHHRVKNNLQVISSLLDLQVGTLDEPRTLSALKNAQGRVQSMVLVHRKLYREEHFGRIDAQDYAEDLCRYLFRAFGANGITWSVQSDGIRFDVETAVPFGLILTELVSNALEHAFPDGREGEVWVTVRRTDENGAYELEVADNGVGLPTNGRKNGKPSIGLTLVEDLTQQLHGDLQVRNGEGVAYTIHFKKRSRSS